MRAAATAVMIALALTPSLAFAQAATPGAPPPAEQGALPPSGGPGGAAVTAPSGPPPDAPPGAISRDQFIDQRAQAAGRLFDQIDTARKGYITRAELRAFIRSHRGGGPGGPPPQQ